MGNNRISLLNNLKRFSQNLFKNTDSRISPKNKSGKYSDATSLFFSGPFFTNLKYNFYQYFPVLKPSIREYQALVSARGKKILWVTDTINDLNGPSVTLKKVGWLSYYNNLNLFLVTSLLKEEESSELPPNLINLPFWAYFKLPYYKKYIMKIPRFIKAYRLLKKHNADEIMISTPGTTGLFSLIAARMLKVKTIGIYHTDFYLQSKALANNWFVPWIVERYITWFYSSMDEIQVPTDEYIDILHRRGYDREKMTIFSRGIDTDHFTFRTYSSSIIKERYSLENGTNLLFTGRMSPDKNLEFLIKVYENLIKIKNNVNLLMVGDGPYLEKLKERTKNLERVVFTGMLDQNKLPDIYSGADLFVFPSISDTFGMSVLEAQTCGLPAVVSNAGGPKEIIIDNITGLTARSNDVEDWVKKILYLIDMKENSPERFDEMKNNSRRISLEKYNWETVLDNLFKSETPTIKTRIREDGKVTRIL